MYGSASLAEDEQLPVLDVEDGARRRLHFPTVLLHLLLLERFLHVARLRGRVAHCEVRGRPLQVLRRLALVLHGGLGRFLGLCLLRFFVEELGLAHLVLVNRRQHDRLDRGLVHLRLFVGQKLLLHLVSVHLRQLVHHIIDFRVLSLRLQNLLLIVQGLVTSQDLPILVLLQQQGRSRQLVLIIDWLQLDGH